MAVVSRHARRIYFCIFDQPGETELYRFALPHRLGDVHFGLVSGIGTGTRYGFRAEGPWDEQLGHRFDASKLLIDPYANELDRPFFHYPELLDRGFDTAALVPKCIVTTPQQVAKPLPHAIPRFIYELQVKSFSKLHPNVRAVNRGTVAALKEPAVIEHLTKLGVDTVELMPLAAWIDERHLPPLGLSNAWGYNPVCFMAPDPRLAPGGFRDIREAVTCLHQAGIRVLLDVVFNHTGESDSNGATLSLRGLDNALYYAHANGALVNDTGCGNTLALDRAPVMQLAMDAMRCWASRTGIDGFRFDLAPVMGRASGDFSPDAPLLAAIEQDPLLSRLTMIAEPWDVGHGGYRLGQFPARWLEWNDRYRDDVRRFWRGDANSLGALATRLAGSSDIFGASRRPSCSINFISAHDGFTLRDAVTFSTKSNFANGENNNDGNSHEPTWPGGDARALIATLFFSHGTPMLTAGDEFGRSQGGNNNAYAQDNATTWLDWHNADQGLINFTARLAELRRSYPMLAADRFLSGNGDAIWVDAGGAPVDWNKAGNRVIGLVLADGRDRIAIWINGSAEIVEPSLQARDGYKWARVFGSAEGAALPGNSVSLFAEQPVRSSGISDETLQQLAAAAGIERDWWEVDGTHHDVSPEALRAMLDALEIALVTPGDASGSLRELRNIATPLLGRGGAPVAVGQASERRQRIIVSHEDGCEQSLEAGPGVVPRMDLAPGYYDVRAEGAEEISQRVIVSPWHCYLPASIAQGRRVYGLASHLYALRHNGDGGIGDFETLRRFAEVTAAAGGHYAGINPLHHLFPQDRERASPYQPSDRRFIDPIYISIATLLETFALPKTSRLAAGNRAAFAKFEALPLVDYVAVWQAKSSVLESAFSEFKSTTDLNSFIASGGDDLARHCAFETKSAGEPDRPERHRYRAFLQWIAEMQLGKAAARRNLYRDLAVGSAFDGGEIAEVPEHFAHGVSLGAPPDPFSRQGQVWNLPPFSPLALGKTGGEPMRAILRANMRHAAALRIDHILGFMRQFWVPRGAEGSAGAYVNFPLDLLIAITAIESQRAQCMIVGEDLGTIPNGLRERLSTADILSYRVLWFERDGLNFKANHLYPKLALSCLASHDLPTFIGWRQSRDIAIDRALGLIDGAEANQRRRRRGDEIKALDEATGASASDAEVAAHGFVAASPSAVMLVQADDLAGEVEPINVPGTDRERPNWRRRLGCPVDRLTERPLARAILDRVKRERPA